MRRNQARQHCRDVNAQKVDANSKLFLKFTESDLPLTADEISRIGRYLLVINGLDPDQQFRIAETSADLHAAAEKLQQRLYIIFKLDSSSRWNVMALEKVSNSVSCYLMNPFGEASTSEIESKLPNQTSLNVSTSRSSADSNDDFLALMHLEMMAKNGLSNFLNFVVPNAQQIAVMKARLKTDILGGIYQKVLCDLKNQEFASQFRGFVLELSKYGELSRLAKNYYSVLKSEVEGLNAVSESERAEKLAKIDRARAEFVTNENVEKLSKMQPDGNDESQRYKFEIERNFPDEMRNINNFLDILFHASDEAKVDEFLGEIAVKVNVEFPKLKQFYIAEKSQQEEKKRGEPIDVNSIPIKTVSDEVEAGVKSFPELLREMEIEEDNENNDEAIRTELRSQISQVESFLQVWRNKTVADIRQWSNAKKGKLQKSEICEAVAVLSRANSLVTGWRSMRNPQLLSILLYFHMNEAHGVLYQILTGEGKTTVVSLLAVLKILMGEQFVDVITSNTVLADTGMKERQDFYAIFDISVSCNNLSEGYVRDMKECYKADIVYGTIGNFQGDYLRHSFENLDTRGERGFGCIILDEVDSILLDNGGHITKLATPFPGMDSLKYVYIRIWQALLKYEKEIPTTFEDKVKAKSDELRASRVSDDEMQKKMDEYREQLLAGSYDDMKQAIIKTDPTNIDIIPPHLREFSKQMLEKWVKNAIYARYQCHENIRYVVKRNKDDEDSIMPVDYENTGVTLKNTVWSDGLHQFVQLKHNLAITTETLTSSFISNIGYVKLYRENLIGMTGTLGSDAEYALLSKVYNLNFAKVPPFKTKKLHEEFGTLVEDDSWVDFIAMDAFLRARNKRSVLIICRTILDVYTIRDSIEFLRDAESFNELKIKIYPDESGSKILKDKVGTSEIIIATNIAGRGADFKTIRELEASGGLHVCVTFLPTNQRVQDQAFGRTSRQGNKGTAQIIAKASDIEIYGGRLQDFIQADSFGEIEEFRDKAESRRLETISNKELPKINFMDEIFQKFMGYYREERGRAGYTRPYLKDMKEHWAFWLRQKNYKDVENISVDAEFKEFKDIIAPHLANNTFRNPFYFLEDAEHLLADNKLSEAKELLEKALRDHSDYTEFLYGAHIKLFEISIEQGDALMDRLKTSLSKVAFYGYFVNQDDKREYKRNAVKYLREAQDGLQKEIDYINANVLGGDFSSVVNNRVPYTTTEDDQDEGDTNIMFMHIKSRLAALQTFQSHCKSFEDQIGRMSNIVFQSRFPQYYRTFKPESQSEMTLKQTLLPTELTELSALGLDVVYSMQEVHEAHPAVIGAAQGQILAGLASLGLGLFVPYLLPVLGPIAGALISEGISDIVIELITQMGSEYSVVAHLKEKAISYGIAIATAGLAAIATCTKVLRTAMSALKKVADVLRKCPIMKSLCTKIAAFLEKVAGKIDTMIEAARVAGKSVPTIGKASLSVASETFRDVMFTVVSEKVTTKILEEIMKNLKPRLKSDSEAKVREIVGSQLVGKVSVADLNKTLVDLSTESAMEAIGDVAKEIGLGVMRAQKSWALKVTSIALDSIITSAKLTAGITTYCEQLKMKLTTESRSDDGNYSADYKFDMISTHISEYMYGQVMKVVGRVANTFVVMPTAGAIISALKPKKEPAESGSDVADKFKRLGLNPNASEEEIRAKVHQMALDDPQKLSAITSTCNEVSNLFRNRNNLNLPAIEVPGGRAPKMAHAGNIKTLSDALETHIVINYMRANGEVENTHEFGRKFKGGGKTIELNFEPGTRGKPGHFTVNGIEITRSGSNNCLYDTISAIYKSKGLTVSPEWLRNVAEAPSYANAKFNALAKVSSLLNNPITRGIFLKAQNSILVGGALKTLDLHPDGTGRYPNAIFDPKEIGDGVVAVFNRFKAYAELAKAFNEGKDDFRKANYNVKAVLAIPPGMNKKDFLDGVSNMEKKITQVNKKGGLMIGALKLKLTHKDTGETKEIKLCAVSGEGPYKFRNHGLDMENIDGYRFVNDNFAEHQKIYNFDTKQWSDQEFTSKCAAGRLNIGAGKILDQPEYRDYKVDGVFMGEVFYKKTKDTAPGDEERYDDALDRNNLGGKLIDSCDDCKSGLPHSRSKPDPQHAVDDEVQTVAE